MCKFPDFIRICHGAAPLFDSARRQNLPKKRRPWSGIGDCTCQMTLAVDLPQVTLVWQHALFFCFSAPVAPIGPWPCSFRGQNSYIIMTWTWCWKDSQHLLIGHSDIWFPCCLPCWPCVVSLSSGIWPWHRPTGSFDDWAAHGCL